MIMEMWMLDDRRFRKLGRMKVAVAVIGGAALSATVGGIASTSAANTQADAATNATNSANATQLAMYNQTRDDQAPYRQAGYGALNTITQDQANGTGFAKPFTQSDFMNDPGYQFQLQQGNQAIERSAAARGGLLSGAAAKSIAGYTTNLANTTYGDAYNRYLQTGAQQYNELAGVAGLGQTSVAQTGAAGTSTANNVANNTINGATQAANARASGYVGTANALSSAGGNLSQYYMLNQAGLLGGGNAYGSGAPQYATLSGGSSPVPSAGMDMYAGM